jgi:hypothetical protein
LAFPPSLDHPSTQKKNKFFFLFCFWIVI